MLLEVNLTMIIFAVSFLIFIYLLNLTLFKPVGKVVEERKNVVGGSYTKAKNISGEISSILSGYEQKIKAARFEAKQIVDEAVAEAKLNKSSSIAGVLKTLNEEKQAAVHRIKKERQEREKELQGKINELKDLITNKVLGREGDKTLVGTH
ncbi:MAG: hypothetical protein HYZ79_05990 [Candidatus Melainabacteria bacterium]|nr:hypothetical protein [Candidatus Melainabacteria bacterium]